MYCTSTARYVHGTCIQHGTYTVRVPYGTCTEWRYAHKVTTKKVSTRSRCCLTPGKRQASTNWRCQTQPIARAFCASVLPGAYTVALHPQLALAAIWQSALGADGWLRASLTGTCISGGRLPWDYGRVKSVWLVSSGSGVGMASRPVHGRMPR